MKVETTKPVTALAPINEARLLVPDIDRLQDLQYRALQAEPGEYARSMDNEYPLWSLCHYYRPTDGLPIEGCWRANWRNIEQMYVFHDLTLEEIARFSSIPLRSVAGHSGKYGWAQAKRTRKALIATENVPDLKDLEEQVRKDTISEFLTQAGYEVGRHALQALLQNVDKIEPRDVPALLMAATKILSMGTGMPESYRHSKVENPNAGQVPNVNILNISGEKAEELLDSLRKRAEVLDQAALLPKNDV